MRIDRINNKAVADLADAPSVVRQEGTVADQILAGARRLAPVLTGALLRSLTIEKVPGVGEIEFRIGWDRTIASYGPLVEFGTEDTPAQPHLRPGANGVKGR